MNKSSQQFNATSLRLEKRLSTFATMTSLNSNFACSLQNLNAYFVSKARFITVCKALIQIQYLILLLLVLEKRLSTFATMASVKFQFAINLQN